MRQNWCYRREVTETRYSIVEYAQAIRSRYKRGNRSLKSRIIDEFVEVTGMHRKSAIRLLARQGGLVGNKRRGRRRVYSVDARETLKVAWEASSRLCSKRLQPFLPELVRVLRAKGELFITDEIEIEMGRLSVFHDRPHNAALAAGPKESWTKYNQIRDAS